MAIVNLAAIMAKVRRLTGTANTLQMPDSANPNDPNSVGIKDYINSFYLYDFPAQFRSLKLQDKYTFNTIRGIDTYAFDSERYTTIQQPCYCAKREIALFNDPWSFFGANFNWQSQDNFATGSASTGPYSGNTSASPIIRSVNNIPYNNVNITNIVVDSPAIGFTTITLPNNPFAVGQQVSFSGVTGTTAAILNGFTYTITAATTASITLTLVSTGLTYTGGGLATSTGSSYDFPTSRVQNILITTNIANGITLNVTDDGNGNLIGDCTAGTINYDTGAIAGLVFTQSVPSGEAIQIQYNPTKLSIPLSILFFQNQFVLRPVPDRGYTIELMAYRQPTQALMATGANQGVPEISEWWEILAFGAAKKIYEDRMDTDGMAMMDKALAERYQLAYTRTYAQLGKQSVNTIFRDQLSNGNRGAGGWGFGQGTV